LKLNVQALRDQNSKLHEELKKFREEQMTGDEEKLQTLSKVNLEV
jgi:hypothetical protein